MKPAIKALIQTVAPSLATALGGPLAGMAVREIGRKVLGNENATAGDVEAYLEVAAPADLVKLKEIDATFKTEMAELQIDLARIAAGDRDSARNRQAKLKDRTPTILAICIVGGFFGVLLALLFVEIPPAATTAFSIVLGGLTAEMARVGQYYFGSSAGSAAKNEIIADLQSSVAAKRPGSLAEPLIGNGQLY